MEQTPGRGRKCCANCKKYQGVRVTICECGYSFDKAISSTTPVLLSKGNSSSPVNEIESTTEVSKSYFGYAGGIIHAAGGECPIELTEISKESTCSFCERLLDRKPYAPSCLKRFALNFTTMDNWLNITKWVDDYMIEHGVDPNMFYLKPSNTPLPVNY